MLLACGPQRCGAMVLVADRPFRQKYEYSILPDSVIAMSIRNCTIDFSQYREVFSQF